MAKSPAKKPAVKAKQTQKPKPKPASKSAPTVAPDRREETMSVRKISNGYVVRESWTEGKGHETQYRERETFTTVKPKVVVAR